MKTKIMNLFSMMESAESAKSAKSIFATFASANFVGKESYESTVMSRVKSRIGSRMLLSTLLMLTICIGNAWGATATFTASDQGWSGTSTKTQTVSGVTFSFAGGTTNPTYYAADGLRTYENCVITISSTNTITGIVFTYTISNSGYLKSFNTGTWTSGTKTWSGSATSIYCTVGHSSGSKNGQVRITEIEVTYTPSASSHTLSSAVSPAASGSVELSATSVAEGSTATATATPATHYVFDHWSISGTGSSLSSTTANPTTITMGTANTTVTATFVAAPKASITLSEAGATTTDASTYYVGDSYTLPSSTDASCGTKVLVGWSTVTVSETDTKPASNFYEKGASVTLAASQTFYAVFATASGGATTWTRVEVGSDGFSLSSVSEGQYALVTSDGHAFNGTITSGHGQSTANATTFTNNVATSMPDGYCELTFTKVMDKGNIVGYTMYNSTNGYLYASAASSGSLAWHNSESSYWKYYGSNWQYAYNSANLRIYNNTFRTYSNSSNNSLWLAKKTGGTTYSDFTTTCATTHTVSSAVDPTGKATVTLGATSVAEGSTTTATYSGITAGYEFVNWTISGTGANLSSTTANPTTITMGTADVTVTANLQCITPSITVHPASKTDYIVGDAATALSVTASAGGASISYQWQVSNNNSDWSNIAAGDGGTAATYTPSTSAAGTKYYRVKVTNAASGCSTNYTSNAATITVSEPSGYCISLFNSSNNGLQSGFSNGGSGNEYTLEFTIPGKDGSSNWPQYWVGENSAWASFSGNATFADMPLVSATSATLGLAEGATGKLHIWDDNKASTNLSIKFEPDGYGFRWGGAGEWNQAANTKAFTVDPGNANTYWTDIVTLDGTNNTIWNYYVGLKTASGYVYSGVDNEASDSRGLSRTRSVTAMKVSNGTAGSYKATYLNSEATGTRGKFRIWDNNISDYNFVCHFVPFYRVTYNGSGASGSTTASADVCCEGNAAARTVQAAANGFTVPTGKQFGGWASSPENAAAGTVAYAANADVELTQSITLYAIWTDIDYNVTYSAPSNGSYTIKVASGTASSATKTANYNQTITIAATPNSNYQFVSWTIRNTSTSADVTSTLLGANSTTANTTFTMPAYGVTITATFVQVYTVTFVHHDKGTFSGGSTEVSVPANNNTITLPTVTSVDCGFYNTFEGWITGSEYAESSDKPATVYAGGSSYTVTDNVTLRALYSYEDPEATGYTKITSGVTAGTYLIVTDGGTAYAGKDGSNSFGGYTSVTVSAGAISSKGSAQEVTITMSSSNFYMNDGTYYLGYSGSSNNMAFDASKQDGNKDLWKLDANGQIESVNVSGRLLEYNSGSPRFACYTGGQTDAFLFRKGGSKYCTNPSCSTPTEVTVTYDANGGGGGSITCSSETLDYGTYPALDEDYTICNTFSRDGYTLYKWSTRADGVGGTDYDPGEVVGPTHTHTGFSGESVTLYAQWRKKVSFNIGNATGSVADVVDTDNDGNITLPGSAGISAIPCGYEFYGWKASSVSETSMRPSGMLFAGDTYNCASATLYAVYRLAGDDVDPNLFSLSYTYSATKYYVSYPVSSTADNATQLRGSTSSSEAAAFGVESVDFQTFKALYYMNEGVKEYLYWYTGDGTSIRHTPTKPTDKGWTINDGVGTKQLVPSNATDRNIKFNSDPSDPRFRPYQDNSSYLTVEEASGTSYTYATSPSCATTATLQFVTNGGTLNYPTAYDASNYVDLTVGTSVYLPTATFAGEWVFEGWRKGSELPSQATSPEGDSNFYTVTLNTTTYTASPAGTTTFYAIFSKTVNDKQWDPNNEGTYKIFAIMSDGTTRRYMPDWGGTQTTLSFTTACPEAGDYTITPGTGVHAGQYKITHGSYTLGVVGDNDTKFKDVADTWWNIEPSVSGKGTYRITIVGSENRCLCYSGFTTFGNYTINQVNSPSQPDYRDVEIGECIYTEYTSTPENVPYITITGSPVKITSTNGERVYSPTTLHVEAHNFTGTRRINFSATNNFVTNPTYVNCDANGAYSGDIQIYYEPSSAGDGSIVSSVLTASQAAESVTQTFTAIRGRNMPQNFVIAAKSGTQWYALPDNCHSSGTPAGVPIEVNDPNTPTAASLVPHNVEWRLSDVVNSNSRPKDKVYFYEPNTVKTADPLTYYNYTLYAGSAPSIQTNAQLSGVNGDNSYHYEWGLSTTDLCAYTISNANVNKNISINESGNFGTHATNVVSDVLYLLPITAYYEPAEFQVLEWKANSVVVMYTGTQTTATTQVGSNSASSAQTLASQKLTHAVYELTTGQALTANAGEALKISFGGGAEIAYVDIPIIINSDVTASESHESQDVVIVSGGKLTAAATKYSFRNIYVYGGGKLKIASGSQLGVNNIIMRAGGVTTNGTGGSATYVYTYPQVELGGTLTSTVADIKYEYITDYDHWYHLCLPFNANLNTIHYPQEYYGDKVTADNTGSWIIKRYAGEIRATGSYDAWKDIETEDATYVTAGHGYIFWGAPKKVSVGEATKVRQQWGIQRMTMSTSASAATSAETANKSVSGLSSHNNVSNASSKPNDQGWNLIGNPYMVNLTGLNGNSIRQGQLVQEMVNNQWTGHWVVSTTNDNRYITVPDDHFTSYEAVPVAASGMTLVAGRTFFVQLAADADAVQFDVTKKASLAPMQWNAAAEQTVDIETGIVMTDETLKDEVDFWIKDGKTEAYEFNADYPKTPNQTNFNIYGVHETGKLSWIAISPEIAEGSMAIGYQVPAAGDYTLSLSEKFPEEKIEALFVTDHAMSPEVTTNLTEENYTFTVHQAESNDERFTVSVKLKKQTDVVTDIGTGGTIQTQAVKFIHNDKLYILRNGLIYDATGKRVSVINK